MQVLDHIHRPPTLLSMSAASLPAAESIIDSFPVKIHKKETILECAEDVSQYVSSSFNVHNWKYGKFCHNFLG